MVRPTSMPTLPSWRLFFRGLGLSTVIVTVSLGAATGCEDDNTGDSWNLSIRIEQESLRAGESTEITAFPKHASDRVTWSLSDSTAGRLSSTEGRTVRYTALKTPIEPEHTIVQTIYCKSESRHLDSLFGDHHTTVRIYQYPVKAP